VRLIVGIIEGGPGSALPDAIGTIKAAANVVLDSAPTDSFDLAIRFQWAGAAWRPHGDGARVLRVSQEHRSVDVDVVVADAVAWHSEEPMRAAMALYAAAIESAGVAAARRRVPFDPDAYMGALRSAGSTLGVEVAPFPPRDLPGSAMASNGPAAATGDGPPDAEADAVGDHGAVTITFTARSPADVERLFSLEDDVEDALHEAGIGDLDGNEVGEGLFTLYLDGLSTDRFAAIVVPVLERHGYGPSSYVLGGDDASS
jgi:hypothetical protein